MELSTISTTGPPIDSSTTRTALYSSNNQQRLDGGRSAPNGWPRFIKLRKYSLAICVLEVLAIATIVGYLLLKAPTIQNDLASSGQTSSLRVYENGLNKTTLLVDLVDGCNQKIHDMPFSVQCRSSNLTLCPQIDKFEDISQQPQVQSWRIKERLALFTVTSKAGDRMETQWMPLKRFSCKPVSQLNNPCQFKTILNIDKSKQHQQIIGWGGALTDSSINNILSLSTNGTTRLLDDYFGQDGLQMNMIRITIGGSDFSSRFYTNLDTPNSEPINSLKLMEEDILYKIPMLSHIQQKYRHIRPTKIFATMWSPPTWMKTNNHFNKGYLKGSLNVGTNRDGSGFNDTYYLKLALLKKHFILTYMQHKIDFWGLTVMNEPIFAVQPFLNFNTMLFPKEEYSQYVAKYLGPVIKNDDRLSHIKIMVHDDNRRFLMQYTDEILENKAARPYIDGVTTHGYIDQDYHLMKAIQDKHSSPSKPLFVLPTELCSGHLPFMDKATMGNWHRGIHYALDIIKGLQHSAAGWVDWNMALDTTGGPGWLGGKLDSPVIVDKVNDIYHKSPMFYVLGQFSKYIAPDSVRIDTSITNHLYDYHLEAVAFLDPDNIHITIVVLNNNPYPVEIYLNMMGKRNDGDVYLITCKADSVTTVKFNEAALERQPPTLNDVV